jgi:hypothetical protein
MTKPANSDNQPAQARSLLAAIHDAPTIILPRRAILVEWLTDFLARASEKSYLPLEDEGKDLAALRSYLRTNCVPVLAESTA